MRISRFFDRRRKSQRSIKSHTRRLTRQARFEPLEQRTLLDVAGGWTIVPGEVLVGLPTDSRLSDIGGAELNRGLLGSLAA